MEQVQTQTLTYGTVLPPFWSEVWLIGCGRSRDAFDFNRLRDQTVVAINDSAFKFDLFQARNKIIFSLDSEWVRKNRRYLAWFQGEKYVALPLETFPECDGIAEVTYLQWSFELALSEDPGFICTGCNSGYGALNLAFLKQAQTIHLVGYDMDPADGDKFRQWAPLFRNTLRQLQERGVRVINHNPDSFIDAFETMA